MLNYLNMFLSKTMVAQTGDESNVIMWFIVLGAAGVLILGGLIFMLVRRKKDSKDGQEKVKKKKDKF